MKNAVLVLTLVLACLFTANAQSPDQFLPPYYIKTNLLSPIFYGNRSINLSFEKPIRDRGTWEFDVDYVFDFKNLNSSSIDKVTLNKSRVNYKLAFARKWYFRGAVTDYKYDWYQGFRVSYANVSHTHKVDCNGFNIGFPAPAPVLDLPTDIIRKSRTTVSYLFGYQSVYSRVVMDVYIANGFTYMNYSPEVGTDLERCNNTGGFFNTDTGMLVYREGNDIRTKGSRFTYALQVGVKFGLVFLK